MQCALPLPDDARACTACGAVQTESHTFILGDFVASVEWQWASLGTVICLLTRVVAALNLQDRLAPAAHEHWKFFWLVPIKDLLQFALWAGTFLGNRIEWRGQQYRLRRDGTLVED